MITVAIVMTRCLPHGNNRPIPIGHYVIAVNIAPFVSLGRPTQMVGPVVHLIAAIPVIMRDPGSPLPFIVVSVFPIMSILRLCPVVPVLVRMLLRHYRYSSKTQSQNG